MDKKHIRDLYNRFIRYQANRKYFGELAFNDIYDAHGQFRRTETHACPVTDKMVRIGHIDGVIICKALLKEMSYNPKRFGTKSPFFHNGYENIYHFCSYEIPQDVPGRDILDKVRSLLKQFLRLNKKQNGSWNDKIETKYGCLIIHFANKKDDINYMKLSLLRDALQLITEQNRSDFKIAAYRNEMINAILKQQSKGANITNTKKTAQTAMAVMEEPTPEELAEDRLDNAEESAQINAETSQYRPDDQVAQAAFDLERIRMIKMNQKIK